MSDLYWPQDLLPARQTWRLIDATAVFTSPFSGATRTVSRPGNRLACSMTLANMGATERHRLMALAAALRGRSNRIWLPDFSTGLRGSFPTAELLGNVVFPNTTGWTASHAELVLTADSGRLRLARSAIAADRFASSPVTTVNGAAYLFRAGMVAGRGTTNYRLQLGTSATGAELASGATQTSASYQQVSALASGTASFASVKDFILGRAIDYFQLLDSPSVARCALVAGASQIGSGLLIDALPASVNGLLNAGDIVAVYTTTWEPKRLIADLNSNASGAGYLLFEPALRNSPADNAPVALYRPTARFMLASEDMSWETRPGLLSDFTFEFIEDIT